MKCNECIWWDTTQTFNNKTNCCKCMNPNAPGYKMWRKWNNNLCKGYGERKMEEKRVMIWCYCESCKHHDDDDTCKLGSITISDREMTVAGFLPQCQEYEEQENE